MVPAMTFPSTVICFTPFSFPSGFFTTMWYSPPRNSVGSSDEWKLVRTQVVDDVVHRNLQMFEETYLAAWLVIEWYLFGEDGEVSRLLDVGYGSEDEPARVVVETATDIIVASFGERLILVIAATVWELGTGDVDDAPLSKKLAERDMQKVIIH